MGVTQGRVKTGSHKVGLKMRGAHKVGLKMGVTQGRVKNRGVTQVT